MTIGKMTKMTTRWIMLLFVGLYFNTTMAQSDSIAEYSGLMPKTEPKAFKGLQVNGFYRFFATYSRYPQPYPLSSAVGNVTLPANFFIGDDAQLPNLLLNISGNLRDGSSWGMDIRMFQFLNGNQAPFYGRQVPDSLRPDIQYPLQSGALGGNLGTMLGMTLYGSFKTKWGSWNTRIGGIQWVAISDLTMSSFRGYNRFMLFERNPWDPIGKDIVHRYDQYFQQGSIDQDNRWGNRAFQGVVIDGQLPNAIQTMIMLGKTEMNGGFSRTPNFSYGGKLKKDYAWGFLALNTINAVNYTDSLAQTAFGNNVITQEFLFKKNGHMIKGEWGAGRYYSPRHNRGFGELAQFKYSTPQWIKGLSFEATYYRVSPKVVNNAALYWNTATVEYSVNDIPAGSIGSSGVLQPIGSSLTRLGQFTNNRQGANLNFQYEIPHWRFSGGVGASKELERTSNLLTVGHPVNQLVRSRLWRWNFPANVGPYNRYSDIYRDTYQSVTLSNDSSGVVIYDKYFNNAELQTKFSHYLFEREFYAFALMQVGTISKAFSPIPVMTEDAYIRQYSSEVECYWRLNSRMLLNVYMGYERTLGNYNTDINEDTRRPMNQYGKSFGLGTDIDLGRNARLYLRRRWFSFVDTSFPLDDLQGNEWQVELKAFF